VSCASFEDLLLNYRDLSEEGRNRLDLHVTGCEGCRVYLDLLHQLDEALSEQFGKVKVPDTLKESVYAKVSVSPTLAPPSLVPEILDLIGWIAVFGIALAVIWKMDLRGNSLSGLGLGGILPLVLGLTAAGAVWMAMRAYSELKS
jgi:hypothetical protein